MSEFTQQCAWEIDEALIWTDLAGTMAWANRRAQALFGYTEAELVGKPVMMLCPYPRRSSIQVASSASTSMTRRTS